LEFHPLKSDLHLYSGSGKDYVFIQEDGTILLAERKPDQAPLQPFDLVVEAADRNGNKVNFPAGISRRI